MEQLNKKSVSEDPEKTPEVHVAMEILEKSIELLSSRLTRLYSKLVYVSALEDDFGGPVACAPCPETTKYRSSMGHKLEVINDQIESLVASVDHQINKLEI